MGLLRIKGNIDLNQFWPTGKSPNILSDADTVHVQVDPQTSFVFERNVTRAFDFAWVTTRKNKDGSPSPVYVIVSQQTANAHVKIRLQGIDAPELHYRVDQQKQEVRQNWDVDARGDNTPHGERDRSTTETRRLRVATAHVGKE